MTQVVIEPFLTRPLQFHLARSQGMKTVDGQRRGLAGHHEGEVVNIGRGPPLALGIHGHYRQIAGLAALGSQTSI